MLPQLLWARGVKVIILFDLLFSKQWRIFRGHSTVSAVEGREDAWTEESAVVRRALICCFVHAFHHSPQSLTLALLACSHITRPHEGNVLKRHIGSDHQGSVFPPPDWPKLTGGIFSPKSPHIRGTNPNHPNVFSGFPAADDKGLSIRAG